jgi:D-serine deaminase-like pyridoxal phosphate-dependent protein
MEVLLILALACLIWRWVRTQPACKSEYASEGWDYHALKKLLEKENLPAMIVDLDIFDMNVARVAAIAQLHKKPIRIATKSIRVPALIQRCLQRHPDIFRGLMCYSPHEALFLAKSIPEARDFLIAYPCVQECDIAAAHQLALIPGATVRLMVDCAEHVALVERLWAAASGASPEHARTVPLCVDYDVSLRIPGLHIGAHRYAPLCRSRLLKAAL